MKVSELVEKLLLLPQDLEVWAETYEGFGTVEGVKFYEPKGKKLGEPDKGDDPFVVIDC